MYLLMKVHKPIIPTRKIIYTKNTVLVPAYIWVDLHLQKTKYPMRVVVWGGDVGAKTQDGAGPW